MHPLVFFAIAAQERAQRQRDDELIWRNARASHASPAAVARDRRWAAAITRFARSKSVECDGAQATA